MNDAKALGLTHIVDSLCFDPAYGAFISDQDHAVGVMFVKDLTQNRLDRASFLNIRGNSAEFSFD